jgi:ATP-binding cassette subfamily B protein
LCPLPFLAIAIYYVNAIINRKSEKIQSLLSTLTSNAQESYSGIRVIKSYVQEKAMQVFFQKNSESYREHALSLAKTEAIYFPSMALIIGLSTLSTIMIGAMDVANGVEGATVGRIAEFVLYIQMLTFPVSAIGWTASMIQRAATSQKRINEFLLTKTAISNEQNPITATLQGNILFENVSFTYDNTGIQALKNINLNIFKGEKIAIVGKTGAGKSTIAQLLLRLYDVDNGTIFYDENPIKKIALNDIRTAISYVPQDVFLFSDSISNNIRFGKEEATPDEIYEAAKKACIYDEIINFQLGFETMVGERGITLSGGQKQRISIARALIKNPEIVIFDDCLSAVDGKTEQQIISNLQQYLQHKTAIIITHRIFSLFQFDKIIVLDEGTIAEIGTHDQLMNQKGIYFEMYNRQQSGEG